MVIGIIAILAALTIPGLAAAKERAKTIFCGNNTMQIGKAFLFYAEDNREKLPDFYTRWIFGNELGRPGKWWFQLLEEGNYAPNCFDRGATLGSGGPPNDAIRPLWKCPSVKLQDVQRIWNWPCGGYGPIEGAVVGWAYTIPVDESSGFYMGSRKLTDIKRPTMSG